MHKILILDSNTEYARQLGKELEKENFEITLSDDSAKAIVMYVKTLFDIVITYKGMEGLDGVKVLESIREINPYVKTILLTDDYDDAMEMLTIDKEIDVYFHREKRRDVLVKQIHHIIDNLRYHKANGAGRLVSAEEGILVDAEAHTVFKNGKIVGLTRKEYELLCLLLSNKGKALSRKEIIENIWANSVEKVSIRAIDGYVKHLRKKLKIMSVESVRGYGYVWN